MSSREIQKFTKEVWAHYQAHGRHDLAWRKTRNPYKILVSEVMLQQTQVPRVKEKYAEFLTHFPTVQKLAASKLSDVLKVWSGLGYNRRGKFLRDAAIAVVQNHNGKMPKTYSELRALPGLGEYTASAILIFAYNQPATLIETNIRAAYIHHFFTKKDIRRSLQRPPYELDVDKVSDIELEPFIQVAAAGQDPREWNWALMDYGSHIKKLHKNPARASKHFLKQSKFEGSLRQVRGAILRELHKQKPMLKHLPFESVQIADALRGLEKDGMIRKSRNRWSIA